MSHPEGLIIYGYAGSTAEAYALLHGLEFQIYAENIPNAIQYHNVIDMNTLKIVNVGAGTTLTNAINKGQMDNYISSQMDSLAASLEYKGAFNLQTKSGDAPNMILTDTIDFSALSGASQGDFYIVTNIGLTEEEAGSVIEGSTILIIGGVEFRSGDHLIVNKDVVGVPTINDIEIIKNTEFPDMVFETREQTLTNKTIDADLNTITNIELDNFKTGVLNIDLSLGGTDLEIASAKAIIDYVAAEHLDRTFVYTIVGDGEETDFVINHNKDNSKVFVQLFDKNNSRVAYAPVEITDSNNVTITFSEGSKPGLGIEYSVKMFFMK